MPGDLDVYVKQGFGVRIGFGARPALLIINFINAFNNPEQLGGGNIQEAIDNTAQLLALARHLDLAIAFTSHVYAEDGSDDNVFLRKLPGTRILRPGMPETEIVSELEPRPGERVVRKHYPSGFFGTDLASWLTVRGADTAIVTGCTTSGCVRATVVPRVSSDRSEGMLRRPRDWPARGEPVRHGSEVCGRHVARRGQGRARHADRRSVGRPERRRLSAPQITCSASSSFSFAFE